jgi:UDP-N-acetyl-2-amino-2-deoxyglucuronate dehydrogenase
MYASIKDRKIRIAVVGCGRIAANHFASIQKYSDDFELVAVCDNKIEALEASQSEHGVAGYQSLSEMLRNRSGG